jgi:FMN reductase [NAD(P)H]
MNKIIETMKNHRSIRKFKDTMIPDDIIDELVAVGQRAPTSLNGQQSGIIVIKDKESKKKIEKVCEDMEWVIECPVFFLFIIDFTKTKIACEKNGQKQTVTDSIESIMVGSVDVGLSMQNVITAAESLGLGAVCIGSIRNDPSAIIKLFDLPEYTYPVCGLCLGYPRDYSRLKPRLDISTYRHDEKYSNDGFKEVIDEYDVKIVDYLEAVDRAQEVNWSYNTSNFYKDNYYPRVYPTLKDQGFKNRE